MQNATGLVLELGVREGYQPFDISSGSGVRNIIIKKPSGSKLTVPALFATDGTDGKIYYVTTENDLNEFGTYTLQAYVELPDFSGYSTIITFPVLQNL